MSRARIRLPATTVAVALVAATAVVLRGSEGATVALEPAHEVSATTGAGAAPAFALAPDGRATVAWVAAPGGGAEGVLHVAADGAAPVALRDPLGPVAAHGEAPPKIAFDAEGVLHALYVVGRVVPGRRFPASALRLARLGRDGRWSAPVTVTDDSTFGSHNFHALHVARDGAVHVAWLDGRHGKSAAFVATSRDGGRTWSRNVRIDPDGEACPCCRTGVAAGPNGEMYVAWRGVLPGGVRDVVLARSADGGATWTEPARVFADDWKVDMCPHAGPAVQVGGDGTVHVAWWTGREGAAGVKYARSTDGGRTFAPPVPLGVAEFSQPAHVQLALGDGGVVAASWEDGTRRTPVALLRISRDGGRTFAPAVELSAAGRAAGFPVLALHGDRVTVAWSEQGAEAAAHAEHAKRARAPKAPHGLPEVGDTRVVARTGRID